MVGKLARVMMATVLVAIALPAWGAAVQVYDCEHDEEMNDDQIDALASEWLKAAKGMPGGENMKASLHFPVAAQAGEIDFKFVIVFPNFEDWGKFTDAYEGSEAQLVDEKDGNNVDCVESKIWESYKVE